MDKKSAKDLASGGQVLPTVVQSFWKGEGVGLLWRTNSAGANAAQWRASFVSTERAGDTGCAAQPQCSCRQQRWAGTAGSARPPAAKHPCAPAGPIAACPIPAEFDLEGLRSKLDEQGLAVATAQEGSVKSRRALADRTKGERGGEPAALPFLPVIIEAVVKAA